MTVVTKARRCWLNNAESRRPLSGRVLPLPSVAQLADSKSTPLIETALLRSFRVQCCLLCLHPLNEMFDPIKDWRICDPRRQQTVMLDFPV
jgi:hypothetical protein